MKNLLLIGFLFNVVLGAVSLKASAGKIYNIKTFGAIADGHTLNTNAIQKAIDQCSSTGGQVLIPSGTFLSGTLYMKSNVELHIAEGGILKGSPDFKDYPDNTVHYTNAFTHDLNGKSLANKAFIFAEAVHHISFTGKGTINGSGDSPEFQLGNDDTPQSRLRPCMLLIVDCQNISLTDLNLKNSAYWMQNYLGCDSLKLQRLSIYNQSNYNQDGIDVDARNVLIEDCRIDVDDDGICFKSHDKNRIVEHVTVRNCTIGSNCNAIKFGTMSIGGLKNVHISNITIHKASADHIRQWQKHLQFIGLPTTALAGIALESVDGAAIQDVFLDNIRMTDVQTPIFIVLGSRKRKQAGDKSFYDTGAGTETKDAQAPGSIRHIVISNITATGQSKMASSITAYPGLYVEDVQLAHIKLNNMGSGTATEAAIKLPENPGAYPENRMYGQIHPASGLLLRHVRGLKTDQMKLTVRIPDHRPAILLDDAIDCVLDKTDIESPLSGAAISILNCKNIEITNPALHPTGGSLVQLSNTEKKDVKITGFRNIPIRRKQ